MKTKRFIKYYYCYTFIILSKCSDSSSLNLTQRKPFYRVITNLTPTFISLRSPIPGIAPFEKNDKYEGYLKDLIDKLSEIIGFDYEINHVSLVKNANDIEPIIAEDYRGMVGQIVRNEVDMAVADMTITNKRLKLVHFFYPFYISGYGILAYRSEIEDWKSQIWNFLNPFKFETWMYILLASILINILRILNYYILDKGKNNESKQSLKNYKSLGQTYELLFENENYNRSVSGKILCCTWRLFRFIVISCYAANLAAFMTVNRMNHPITSVNDLVNQDEIEYGAKRYSSIMGFLKHSTIPVYQKMYKHLDQNDLPEDLFFTVEEIVEHVRLKKGKYVHLTDRIDIDYLSSKKPCDLVGVGETFDLRGLGIAMNLNLPFQFKRDVDLAIIDLLETGWFDSQEQKWWHSKNECESPKDKLTKPTEGLTVTKLGGVFFILFIGIILAIITGFGEYFQRSYTCWSGEEEVKRIRITNLNLCKNCNANAINPKINPEG